MITMNLSSWADYKTLVSAKMLLMQYSETGTAYHVFSSESNSFMWCISLLKGSSDGTDFENSYKSAANAPLETKAASGRPERVAPSPQPNNTTEKWLGFHIEMTTEDQVKTLDIQFDTTVYLKGGEIYSSNCDASDIVKADVVLVSNPSYVVQADILKNVYMFPGHRITFLSSECMLMPTTVMLRVTYTKGGATDTIRSISALADYFKPNS